MTAHRPKKSFGQNFLRDQGVIQRILAAAELRPEDRVLEIGPGLGALTEHLLQGAGQVKVIELDRDLAGDWQQREDRNLEVICGDALKLDWTGLLPGLPWKMVANLPYNISSQIVFKILDQRRLFSRLVLMFQKEVGDRLAAAPGSRTYGVLSVLCQVWFRVRPVTEVAPQAFFPPPKVRSVVLCFEPYSEPLVDVGDEMFFRKVVKAAFVQRRKTLPNSLTAAGFPPLLVRQALEQAKIEPKRRGETLTLVEFSTLAATLTGLGATQKE